MRSQAVNIGLKSIAIVLLLSGCAGPTVKYQEDFNTSEDFSALKQYSWHTPNIHNSATKEYLESDLVDQRIRSDIEQQLSAKGFVKSDPAEADFFVNFTITVSDDVEVHNYNTYETDYGYWGRGYYGYRGNFGSPYRYYGPGYGPVRTETHQRYEFHKVGTLVIDIVNASTGRLSWRGTAEGTLDKEKVSAQERDERLDVIIEKTLHDFPPQAANAG